MLVAWVLALEMAERSVSEGRAKQAAATTPTKTRRVAAVPVRNGHRSAAGL